MCIRDSYLLRKAALQIQTNERTDAEKTLSIVRNFINDDAGKLITYMEQVRAIGNDEAAEAAMARAYEIANNNTFVTLRYASLLLDLQSNDKAKLSLISIILSLGFNKSWLSLVARRPLLDVWVEC